MQRQDLKKIKLKKYFYGNQDISIQDEDNKVVSPTKDGMDLVCNYYAEKYQTEIFVTSKESLPEKYKNNFFLEILRITQKNQAKQLQQVYILRSKSHSHIYVYLRDGDKQAILNADSLDADCDISEQDVEEIHERFGNNIKLYFLSKIRQGDLYSCHTDGLVWGRVVSAKGSDGTYLLSDLLSFLDKHSHEDDDVEAYIVDKLPDELLITSQRKNFLEHYSKAQKKLIHKKMDLTEFTKGYEKQTHLKYFSFDKGVVDETKPVASYLRKKGLKYAAVIEIQFYAEQLSKVFVERWPEVKEEYYNQAKTLVRAKSYTDLYEFANEFQNKLQKPSMKP